MKLSIQAVDPSGGALTYTWQQFPESPAGTFSDATSPTPTWLAPVVKEPTAFTLRVTVMDRSGGTAQAEAVTVPVHVPRYAQDIQVLWDSLCTRCHGRSGGLDLAPGRSHAALTGAPMLTRGGGQLMRVVPGDPEASALVMKLAGTGCGSRMPRNAPGHFDAHPGELVRIRSWILGGAADD